jgi:magnesium-transporting ATPase (P-type)
MNKIEECDMTAREMEPVPQQQTQGNAWHTFDADTVLAHLATSPQGLPAAEIERRREHYGPNTLPKREPPTLWQIVLHQIMNPLIYILIAAAVLALITGDAKDAIFIAVVIGLNTALGTYQEYQAEQSASAAKSAQGAGEGAA